MFTALLSRGVKNWLRVYSCMLECNCEKIGSAGSFYACVILAAVLLLLNMLHKEKEVNCVRRLRWGQLIDY